MDNNILDILRNLLEEQKKTNVHLRDIKLQFGFVEPERKKGDFVVSTVPNNFVEVIVENLKKEEQDRLGAVGMLKPEEIEEQDVNIDINN